MAAAVRVVRGKRSPPRLPSPNRNFFTTRACERDVRRVREARAAPFPRMRDALQAAPFRTRATLMREARQGAYSDIPPHGHFVYSKQVRLAPIYETCRVRGRRLACRTARSDTWPILAR